MAEQSQGSLNKAAQRPFLGLVGKGSGSNTVWVRVSGCLSWSQPCLLVGFHVPTENGLQPPRERTAKDSDGIDRARCHRDGEMEQETSAVQGIVNKIRFKRCCWVQQSQPSWAEQGQGASSF